MKPILAGIQIMKTSFQLIICGLIAVAVTSPAHALFIELGRPGLSFPEGFTEETRREIQEVLERSDYHFLGGSALNWDTTLRYEGSTKSLNTFLHGLAACEGVRIKITFVESLPEDGVWHVNHSAHEDEGLGFHIRISVGSGKVALTELVLPVIRGRSNVDQVGADL